MINFQTFLVAFEFWAALFCIILSFILLMNKKYDKVTSRIVLGFLYTNVVITSCDALAYIFRGNTTTLGYYMVRITNFLVFFGNLLLFFFLMLYLCHIIYIRSGKNLVHIKKIVTTDVAVSVLLLILSRIFKFYYYFDADNKYYRLSSYWIMYAVIGISVLILITITFIYWKYFEPIERVEFILFEFFPYIALIIQLLIYGVSITTIINTFAVILVFLGYELDYSKYLVRQEQELMEQVISALASAIDEKDPYTGGHSQRVANYSKEIAERLKLPKDKVIEIYEMGLLHDVGKIGIDDVILKKDGKLTDDEYKNIQNHTILGSNILSNISDQPSLLIGAKYHHERYDGKGYPEGLKGNEIPLEARIICVADSYDAMSSKRRYRNPLRKEEILEEIKRNSGYQFDPLIADVMIDMINDATFEYENEKENSD